jgi:hypothetical protein
MNFVYAIPGIAALIEWALAAALYALGWYRTRPDLNRFGDSLATAGFVTAFFWGGWLVLITELQSGLATGLALSALAVYAVIARRRPGRLSAAVVLSFANLVQIYAVGQVLWRGAKAAMPVTYPPLWMGLRTLIGLVGYGALTVSALMILLSVTLIRARGRLPVAQLAAVMGLPGLEWRSWQIALVALSLSLSIGLIHTWWGLGQVMVGGFPWALITWLLLAAAAFGLIRGATPRRPARTLLVLAWLFGLVSVLTIASPW